MKFFPRKDKRKKRLEKEKQDASTIEVTTTASSSSSYRSSYLVDDIWKETLTVVQVGGEMQIRSYFVNQHTQRGAWDKPPPNALSIQYASDQVRKTAAIQLENMKRPAFANYDSRTDDVMLLVHQLEDMSSLSSSSCSQLFDSKWWNQQEEPSPPPSQQQPKYIPQDEVLDANFQEAIAQSMANEPSRNHHHPDEQGYAKMPPSPLVGEEPNQVIEKERSPMGVDDDGFWTEGNVIAELSMKPLEQSPFHASKGVATAADVYHYCAEDEEESKEEIVSCNPDQDLLRGDDNIVSNQEDDSKPPAVPNLQDNENEESTLGDAATPGASSFLFPTRTDYILDKDEKAAMERAKAMSLEEFQNKPASNSEAPPQHE